MNIHKGFDFSQLGGFPLNQQRLEYMQAAYTELSGALASVFNGNVILSGCIIAGLNVSDGWVVVNGEILPFIGSTTGTQTTFLVRETRTPILFKDGQNRNVQFSRFCQFGSGTGAIAWSSLTRLNSLLTISNHVNRVDNPHGVTKTQVGLGSLPNAKTDDPAVNDPNILATSKAVATHVLNKSNPHAVTKTQVGLGNLPNAKTDDPAVNDTNILATSKMVVAAVSTATAGVLSIFQQGFVELVYNQPAPRININKQLALGKIGVIANIYAYQKTSDTYSDLYFNAKEHLLSAVEIRFSNATGMAESLRIGFDVTQTNASTKYYLEYMIYQKP